MLPISFGCPYAWPKSAASTTNFATYNYAQSSCCAVKLPQARFFIVQRKIFSVSRLVSAALQRNFHNQHPKEDSKEEVNLAYS
jgi:hypothetical protein